MKTLVIGIAVVAMCGVTYFMSTNGFVKKEVSDDVLLENVEALASSESGLPTYCLQPGSLCCRHGKYKYVFSGMR